MKEFHKDFEKRLNNFCFKSTPPTITKWHETDILEKVYAIEMKEKFRSVEERLLYRTTLWIEMSKINYRERVFRRVCNKRHITPLSPLNKIKGLSLKRTSKSMENLDFIRKDDNTGFQNLFEKVSRENAGRFLVPARSAIDLRSTKDENKLLHTANKYGTTPKRKFKFFFFKRKSASQKSSTDMSQKTLIPFPTTPIPQTSLDKIPHQQIIGKSLFEVDRVKHKKTTRRILENNNGLEESQFDPKNRHLNSNINRKYYTIKNFDIREEFHVIRPH